MPAGVKWRGERTARRVATLAMAITVATATIAKVAMADQGGVSFWLPGLFGSLASAPGEPGWSYAGIYIHSSVKAGGNQQFAQGGEIRAGIDGDVDLVAFGPSYIFEEPVLGGQAALSLQWILGHAKGSVEATLTGPNGNEISGERTDTLTSYGDLLPLGSIKWNEGVNNFMVYMTGDIPIGDYDAERLANLGLGHAAIDGGIGYTYFNPHAGTEFSITGGLTYNFENPDTDYQNGIDGHIDWAASIFPSESFHIGPVGYVFQQVTGDSGEGATLGDFKSRVFGIGGQFGHFFPAGDMMGYLNIKGYHDFEAENRPEGWSVWLTLADATPRRHWKVKAP